MKLCVYIGEALEVVVANARERLPNAGQMLRVDRIHQVLFDDVFCGIKAQSPGFCVSDYLRQLLRHVRRRPRFLARFQVV